MPAVDFFLTALDNDINVLAASIGDQMDTSDNVALPKAVAKLAVQVTELREIFKFATNAADLTDASDEDMYFFVDANGFRDMEVRTDTYATVVGSLAGGDKLVDNIGKAYVDSVANVDLVTYPKQGIDFENDAKGVAYTCDNKGIVKDLFRDLANQLFNTQYGVDIFSNEADLSNDVHTNTSALINNNGNIWNALNDASGKDISDSTEDNIGRILFETIVKRDSSRLQDMSYVSVNDMNTSNNENHPSSGSDNNNTEMRLYNMPFQSGDSINFHLTYKYDANQGNIVGINSALNDRIYQVVLELIN